MLVTKKSTSIARGRYGAVYLHCIVQVKFIVASVWNRIMARRQHLLCKFDYFESSITFRDFVGMILLQSYAHEQISNRKIAIALNNEEWNLYFDSNTGPNVTTCIETSLESKIALYCKWGTRCRS
jgi:hypothetical protein